jgi:amino acid permease
MRIPSRKKSIGAGVAVLLSMFALSWLVVGLVAAIFFWLWLSASALLVLYFLGRKSKSAKIAAVILEPNTIFLFFLPKHIRTGIESLRQRENKTN